MAKVEKAENKDLKTEKATKKVNKSSYSKKKKIGTNIFLINIILKIHLNVVVLRFVVICMLRLLKKRRL